MLRTLLSLALLCCLSATARSEGYPDRPVRVLVPYPAGSAPDNVVRLIAPYLKERMGTPFIIENKAGAQGIIAMQELARSKPDGYTIAVATHSHTGILPLTEDVPFDPKKAFAPIAQLIATRTVMVVRDAMPAKTLQEFAAYARAHPGEIFGANGSAAGQLQVSALKRLGGFEVVDVPYAGTNSMLPDLLSGRITFTFTDYQSALPFLQSGKLRALGVVSPNRVGANQSIPAIAEAFPGYDQMGWIGLLAPAGTPPSIIAKLNDAVRFGLAKLEIQKRYTEMFFDPASPDMTAADFAHFLVADTAKWEREVKAAGLNKKP